MVINPKIKDSLESFKIDYQEGLLCLLGIYYKAIPSFIPEALLAKVFASGIVILELDKTYTWKVPLFQDQETNFAWVNDYRAAFKKINSDRAGSLSTCIIRMKKFFADNPHIRIDDVKGATKMYLASVKDPQYLITSHKFIYDGAGATRNSHLEEWIEKYKELQGINLDRRSESKTMQ